MIAHNACRAERPATASAALRGRHTLIMFQPLPGEFTGTDRFRIEDRLGSGAFGVVYRAFDAQRGQTIALKLLNQAEADPLYRFKREFRQLANVRHPNLVTFHELISDGARWFLVMELVEGVDFLEYVSADAADASGLPFDLARLEDAARQLAVGLAALHTAGILHRDVKPSNVLVTKEGRVKILDFGLATDLASHGMAASLSSLGTPTYVAPEQALGHATTTAADWYSVGVMLYEALTGRPPFTGKAIEVMVKKQTVDAPAPCLVMPGVPEHFDALCSALLRKDPAKRPSDADVLSALGALDTRPAPQFAITRGGSRSFVGRHAELAALTGAYQTSARAGGRAVLALLSGGSGVGKTALARRFLDAFSVFEPRALVLRGRCYDRESMPFKALDSVVDALSSRLKSGGGIDPKDVLPRDVHALARLFPVLRQVRAVAKAAVGPEIPDAAEVRRRAATALRELLTNISARRPLAIFVDDLHWADADSAPLLAEILRPPDAPRLLFVGAYRAEDAETSPFLRLFLPLVAEFEVESCAVEVSDLSPSEARDLALSLLEPDTPDRDAVAESVARESGGNPYFLNELVRYVRDVGRIERVAGDVGSGDETLLDRIIVERVAAFPEKARRMLDLLAVAGRPIELGALRQAAWIHGEEFVLVDQLRLSHLVRSRGSNDHDQIELYQDRIRHALLGRLSSRELKDLHLRLAFALESAQNPDPEALAVHLLEGGERWLASKQALTAADRAAGALAFDRAARLLRMALDLDTLDPDDKRAVRLRLADALVGAGRGAEAAAVYREAAGDALPAESLELRRRAAEQLVRSGHIDEGLAALREIADALGMRLAESRAGAVGSFLVRRAELWFRGLKYRERDESLVPADELLRVDTCWSVATGLSLVDTTRGAEFQTSHLMLALQAGEPYRIARALAVEAGYRATKGGASRQDAERLSEEAHALAERIGSPHAVSICLMVRAVIAFLGGKWALAREHCDRAERILREQCTGAAWELQTCVFYLLRSLEMLGETRALTSRLPALLAESLERGDLWSGTNLRVRLGSVAALAADDPVGAEATVSEAIAAWTNRGFHMQHLWALTSRVSSADYAGDAEGAWRMLEEQWDEVAASPLMRVQMIRVETAACRARTALSAAAAVGERSRHLLDEARRAATRVEREHMDWSDALAALVRAGVAAHEGDEVKAVTLLEAAEAGLERSGMALHAASARRARGLLLGGAAGRSLADAAEAAIAVQAIKRPDRYAALLAPGFEATAPPRAR
jgi:hypothetical protein